MAIYKEDLVNIDLENGNIFRSFLTHTIGSGDNSANRFGIRAFRNGVAEDLSGASCQAIFMNAAGVNIALTSYGTVSGNKAYVTLPQACYNVEGQFCLAIKLVKSGVTVTSRIVDGVVCNTGTTGSVAPTSSVPTYQEILDQYAAMVAATSAANTAIAETFDASKAYPAGKNVINSGALYILPNGHEAGTTWANTTKVASNLGDQVTDLKSACMTYRGQATGTTIASNASAGWYSVDSSIVDNFTDLPDGASVGNIINVSRAGNISINNVKQYYVNALDGQIWERLVVNGTAYNSWVRYISGSEYDTNALKYNGIVTGTTLVGNLLTGWYSIDSSVLASITDKPDGSSVGCIINIPHAGNLNINHVRQFYVDAIDGKTWGRLIINGSAYNSWVRYIIGTEYDALASNVFKYNGAVSGTTLTENLLVGWYAVNQSVFENITDAPDGAETGTLLNIPYSANISANNIRQFYINGFNGRTWSRHVANGSVYIDWQCVGAGSYNVIWYALGDSITAGVYSNDQGEPVTVYNPAWAYPNQVARDYKCTVHNVGVPGKAITDYESLLSYVHSDATLITITGGANDYVNKTNPLGDVNSTADYTTVCGALKSIIETVASTAPNARIVLISPWLIKYGSLSTKWSLNYAVSNKGNFTYDQLSDAMKAIAEYYNIEFIDGTHEGPVNILNIGDVLKDNVHPTKIFYDTISNWVGSKLF